ncbi:MAG: energy transducer TonB [Flavobacteriales bacterium]|nr:energy transducer TonB [Flavobacteriales bacterium]
MELKKNPEANLEVLRKTYLQIGLVVALGLVFILLEWRTYEGGISGLGKLDMDMSEEEIIPITQPEKPPPPPPPKQIVLVIVEDDEEIEEELEMESSEDDEDMELEIIEEEVVEDEVFMVVEKMPEFPGGIPAMMKYLGKNIKYPELAKEAGISGRVFVTFVIDKSGKVNKVKLLRGIGGGCDEEAIRVVKAMPPWTPGKQRGKAVSVQFNLPINYDLQ